MAKPQIKDEIDTFITAVSDVATDDPVIFITWSPRPSTLHYSQEKNYVNHIHDIFFDFHTCMSKFALTPELNVNGNIHYHGWFVVKDSYRLYKYVIPRMKRQGFVSISKCRGSFLGPSVPYAYHLKDIGPMAELMYPYIVPYTHNNYKVLNNLIKYTLNINIE